MRAWRRAIAVCVVMTLGGCSYQGSKRTAKAGGWIALAGVPTLIVGEELGDCGGGNGCNNRSGLGVAVVGFIAIPVGAAIAVLGLVGMLARDSPAEEARQADERRVEEERLRAAREENDQAQGNLREAQRRAEARLLGDKATTAAAAGDCSSAALLARRVSALDDELYRTDVSKRPAVAACLAGP